MLCIASVMLLRPMFTRQVWCTPRVNYPCRVDLTIRNTAVLIKTPLEAMASPWRRDAAVTSTVLT